MYNLVLMVYQYPDKKHLNFTCLHNMPYLLKISIEIHCNVVPLLKQCMQSVEIFKNIFKCCLTAWHTSVSLELGVWL